MWSKVELKSRERLNEKYEISVAGGRKESELGQSGRADSVYHRPQAHVDDMLNESCQDQCVFPKLRCSKHYSDSTFICDHSLCSELSSPVADADL